MFGYHGFEVLNFASSYWHWTLWRVSRRTPEVRESIDEITKPGFAWLIHFWIIKLQLLFFEHAILKSIHSWWTWRSKCSHHSKFCCSCIIFAKSIWPKKPRQVCLSRHNSKHFFLCGIKNVVVGAMNSW